MSTQNLTAQQLIEQAIIANGGKIEDISFLNSELANDIGKQLAAKGIKSRTPNPAFNVTPINTVEGIKKHFDWMYDWITPAHCPLKPVADEAKIVELIKCTPNRSTDDTLREIDELGFEPAPSNYVLGLGVQHPDAHKEYKYIVSLDKQNLFADRRGNPCFLCLFWYGERDLFMVLETVVWHDDWWFAVVRKSTSKP